MAFIFSWPLALCTLGILPIFLICGVIEQKADQENMMDMAAAEGSEDMELSDDDSPERNDTRGHQRYTDDLKQFKSR